MSEETDNQRPPETNVAPERPRRPRRRFHRRYNNGPRGRGPEELQRRRFEWPGGPSRRWRSRHSRPRQATMRIKMIINTAAISQPVLKTVRSNTNPSSAMGSSKSQARDLVFCATPNAISFKRRKTFLSPRKSFVVSDCAMECGFMGKPGAEAVARS